MNHPNLSEDINRRITESELFGGIWASEPTGVNGIGENVMPVGAVVEVETLHNVYRIEKRAHGGFFIDGHPEICPDPTPCSIHGSTWGSSMIKVGWIGRGMHLEFSIPNHAGHFTTTQIQAVRVLVTPEVTK